VRSRSWRLSPACWPPPSHLRREPTRTAYAGKCAKRVFANPSVSMKRTAFFWTIAATRIFTFPTTSQTLLTTSQTLPQAVRPAAADIEGHSAAAKFGQPGGLGAEPLARHSSLCRLAARLRAGCAETPWANRGHLSHRRDQTHNATHSRGRPSGRVDHTLR
jgi:hypothetical protein